MSAIRRAGWVTVFGLALACGAASAQTASPWPQKSVRVVVPFAAGGNTDAIARIAAERLAQVLGQQFVVENRVGAGGAIAAELVAKAPPDGYTLFVSSVAQLAVLPFIQKVAYDPVADFTPISIIGSNPLVLGISTTVLPEVKTLRDLVAQVRARPADSVAYASGGTGSLSHLVMVMLMQRAGLAMEHVNYKGGAPAMVDLLGGQVPMYFGNLADYLPHAKSDRLRLIATSGDRRAAIFPDVPRPDFPDSGW
jgi:tripartite-type tricarboxylate transporter receptor subunit TctC